MESLIQYMEIKITETWFANLHLGEVWLLAQRRESRHVGE